MPIDRDALLRLSDEALLRLCRVDVFRGTGHGGQKRNRTDSAVRITHVETGAVAGCDETRSQLTNREIALRKLRREIALTCRAMPPSVPAASGRPGLKSTAYPFWVGAVLDQLEVAGYKVSDAATACGVSTSRLIKDLAADPTLWQTANAGRRRHALPPLRQP